MAKETMEVTVFPTIDWSNLLAVMPTEQLEAEIERREHPIVSIMAKRREQEGSSEALLEN